MTDFDYCIIGGGVIGLACAYELSHHGSVLLLEQNNRFGAETSSRNSEVIHAGLYYAPGSLKERLCIEGKQRLYRFCEAFDVPRKAIGKLIVAPESGQEQLTQLLRKGRNLGIPLQLLDQQQLQDMEPQVRGYAALYSPTTGIIDSHSYMERLAQQAEQRGALLLKHSRVVSASERDNGWQIEVCSMDGVSSIRCAALVNAAGLQAQKMAHALGIKESRIPKLYLCRGHYFSYQSKNPFRHLIYPLPEKNLAGLGIHATLDLGNQLRFGPDTEYLSDDTPDYRVDPALAPAFARAIQRYFPGLKEQHLQPDYAGIRPKLHTKHETAADFNIQRPDNRAPAVHLFGIESPGLTASLAIGTFVTEMLQK
ncbi:NAD(P)/FAD-dependent oxidoreductase [Thalassolituus sp. UBA2009]|jgi:L-2-hydroxyglutarate oxidase LhgO|uniref:NAD(P)/FAD-dependent oxidoreductase n=1 Tax=Thalassolituus sp. UBA2009 TaxID=1947658 RepID=UPI00257B9E6F|nr:NAD(P)/FAD-dependent oxidoreductase [Thalassolituus sp. UBA2009]